MRKAVQPHAIRMDQFELRYSNPPAAASALRVKAEMADF